MRLCAFCNQPGDEDNPVAEIAYGAGTALAHFPCTVDSAWSEAKDRYVGLPDSAAVSQGYGEEWLR